MGYKSGRRVLGIKLRRTEKHGYDAKLSHIDFHVRKENHRWVLDVFNSKIKDHNIAQAHVYSDSYATLRAAVHTAINLDYDHTKKP